MKNLRQISAVFVMLLIGAAAIGLAVWRFAIPESSMQEGALPQPVVTQTSTIQNSAAVTTAVAPAPVVEPVTEPAAVVAESSKQSGEDLQKHDEQMEPPSPEVINAIREIKKPTPDEGKIIKHADGSTEIKLGNRFQSVPVATIGKDGKVHVDYHGEKYLQENQSTEAQKPEAQTP